MTNPRILKDTEHIITTDDILGKDVIDIRARHIGVLTQIHIDKDNKSVIGITIDTGFMKPQAFVGLNFIEKFGKDAIYIKQSPSSTYIGLKVFDRTGKYIGKAANAILDEKNRDLTELHVKISLFKTIRLTASQVHSVQKGIFLKIEKEELEL